MCKVILTISSNAVVTRFTLKKAACNTGINFSQAQFSMDRVLTPEEHALISTMTEQVKALSTSVGNDTEDRLLDVNPEIGKVIDLLKFCGAGIKVDALCRRLAQAYIMHEERSLGLPSASYVAVCREGYDAFGQRYLTEAIQRSAEELQ